MNKISIEKGIGGYKVTEEKGMFAKAEERYFSNKKELISFLEGML